MKKTTNLDERSKLIQFAREQSFSNLILDKFYFERTSIKQFWNEYQKNFYQHVPLELFFEGNKLRTNFESKNLNILNSHINELVIEDNYLLLDSEKNIVAMMRGWQNAADTYYMQFTAVHSEYRKKGIYSALIDRVLNYTRLLGFPRVVSCHAPCNNPVIIAKLKKDFKIIGMDIDAALGINVWLCYFHNKDLKKAFELRCGKITFNEQLFSASLGTAAKLADVLTRQ